MPENPVMPLEEDFTENPAEFEQAQSEFQTKQAKWNTLQGMLENGTARKVVVIDNLTTVSGYILPEKETPMEAPENTGKSDSSNPPASLHSQKNPNNPVNPDSPSDNQNTTRPVTVTETTVAINPDLLAALEAKDRSNREEALYKVMKDVGALIGDTEIPPVEITPFEQTLLNFVMLDYLDKKHYEFFGIIEGQSMSEDIKLNLYTALSEAQQNVLKRDFLMKLMLQRSGTGKRSALLIELAKIHFPDELAVIENTRNEEYLKKRQVILEKIDKINASNEEVLKVA